jgi:hypothetical protein
MAAEGVILRYSFFFSAGKRKPINCKYGSRSTLEFSHNKYQPEGRYGVSVGQQPTRGSVEVHTRPEANGTNQTRERAARTGGDPPPRRAQRAAVQTAKTRRTQDSHLGKSQHKAHTKGKGRHGGASRGAQRQVLERTNRSNSNLVRCQNTLGRSGSAYHICFVLDSQTRRPSYRIQVSSSGLHRGSGA